MQAVPNRRRRPLLTSAIHMATAALVTYGTYQLASWAWNEWCNQEEEEEEVDNDNTDRTLPQKEPTQAGRSPAIKTSAEYDESRCRKGILMVFEELLPKLSECLESHTDISQETKELKRLRQEKRNVDGARETLSELEEKTGVLWNQIKVKLMTRLISTVYAHTLLWLLLSVHENLMSRQLQSSGSLQKSQEQTSDELDPIILKLVQPFFRTGILHIVQTVSAAVEMELLVWDVTSIYIGTTSSSESSTHVTVTEAPNTSVGCSLTREEFRSGIEAVRRSVQGLNFGLSISPSKYHPSCSLRDSLLPRNTTDTLDGDNWTESILREAQDIIQSPLFECAQDQCIHVAFSTVERYGWMKIFQSVAQDPWKQHGIKGVQTAVPLASILSQIKQTIQDVFYVSVTAHRNPCAPDQRFPNVCVKVMDPMDIVHELGSFTFH